jgi:antitoxin component YwqK of YwqJK toxin-antitoxin module
MAEEHFKDGKLSGEGEYAPDGRRHGPWTFYFRNGQVKAKGSYRSGQLDGAWIWYRESGGLLQQGAFVDGAQDGRWRRRHHTGKLLDEGTYAMGKKTGQWVTYGKDGVETKRKKNHR